MAARKSSSSTWRSRFRYRNGSPDNDPTLAEAFTYASQKMPVVTALVASKVDQANPGFAVPLNMLAAAFGSAAMANLTVDEDGFVRRQVMIEAPEAGTPGDALNRSMSLHAAEKFLDKQAKIRGGRLYLGDREISRGPGPQHDDQLRRSVGYVFEGFALRCTRGSAHAGNRAQIEKWVKGKVVLLGPDDIGASPLQLRSTPAFGLTDRWETAGVEVHANSLQTILKGNFLRPAPDWARLLSLLIMAGGTMGRSWFRSPCARLCAGAQR